MYTVSAFFETSGVWSFGLLIICVVDESRLSQSYMMPLNLQPVPDLRLVRVSAPIAAAGSGHVGDVNTTIDRIAKKGENGCDLSFFY